MLRWILAYTLAVLATQALPALPPWWLGALVLTLALWPWRYRPLALAVALGFALTLWRAEARLADRWTEARQGEEVIVTGHIASLPEQAQEQWAAHNRGGGAAPQYTWRFTFEPDRGDVPRRIRSSWYRTPETLRGGDCWRFTLRLKSPRGSQNPDGFDYEAWLYRQGLGANATVRAAERCDEAGVYPVLRLRQAIRDRLDIALPPSPARGVLTALVLGDASGLRDADWDAFRLTGTSHLVAISGFNLAIVAGFAFFLLRWSWGAWPPFTRRLPAQKAAALGAAGIAIFYALLAGFEPPVTRALMMLLIGLGALFLNRSAHPFRVLALAWGVILLADPFAVLSAGLWLSFGAVAAIVWLASGRLGTESGWRTAVRVQLLLTLLLAPLTLFFFQGTAWIAPFVNLLAVPWFALLTPLALVAVLLLWIMPALAMPLLHLTDTALAGTHTVLRTLAETHADGWLAAAPPSAALLLALLGAALLTVPRGVPLRGLGLLCLLPLAGPPHTAPRSGFTLTALDVGQGLAVVVRTANHTLLFDTGPAYEEGFDAGRSVVVPYLLGQGVRQLDMLLVSHGDLDHRGGAPAVRAALSPLEERGAFARTPCAAGQAWQWDDVRFTVLNGPADAAGEPSADNNGGCVLRVETGSHAALLPADIEKDAEARLLRDHPEALSADVLVAAHHGSRTSSTPAFVEAVNPEVVIFSAGYANSYRHPRPEVVARFQRLGIAMHMTGHEGALTLPIDPQTGAGDVQAWRQVWPRYWWAAVLPVPHLD
ncbi:MAG: DNA internalization-related competence protein ComEC/Rec2 [Stagnimonas sp.]|nr:DNA internalization-related competence protein ComEC/Rec2 [Stagnimonas sp.]